MDFQTASGQEVFRRGSGFGFELRPKVYRLTGPVCVVPKLPAHHHSPVAWYGLRCPRDDRFALAIRPRTARTARARARLIAL
jgi:hypothetical protein